MNSGRYRYVVQCYDHQTGEGLRLNVCTVDVFADSEQEAIGLAQQLVSRPKQTVVTVIEQDVRVPLAARNGV